MDNDPFIIEAMSHLTGALESALHEIGPEVVSYIQDSISIPVGQQGGRIIRSAPGEPPRLETGALRASIEYEVTVDFETVSLNVYATAPYAYFLEFGTDRMEARPYLGPARDYWSVELPNRLSDELASTLY